ncbi:MAG: hypothetical protein Q4B71_05230 [Cardiobacteriaceae bacterium]|nr:hypothetical protein [Cardiobacteriaceae bacterium]
MFYSSLLSLFVPPLLGRQDLTHQRNREGGFILSETGGAKRFV